MINQIDKVYWHKLNGLLRKMLIMGVRPPGQIRPLVNEYPKSGGSWLGQMISEIMNLPFPRNRLPTFRDSVMHGHYKTTNVMCPVVNVIRDGRDVVTSFYYHRLIKNEFSDSSQRVMVLKKLNIDDPLDVQRYMPRFIELLANGGMHPYIAWSDFVISWQENKAVVANVKYEDMLVDSSVELVRVCDRMDIDVDLLTAKKISQKYSFATQAKRSQGTEVVNNYLRKGISGDWKEKFNLEARQIFNYHMGHALIELEYEKDSDWVDVVAKD